MRRDAEHARDLLRREPALFGELRVVQPARELVVIGVAVDQHHAVRAALVAERLAQPRLALLGHLRGDLEHAGGALGAALEESHRVLDELVAQADHAPRFYVRSPAGTAATGVDSILTMCKISKT